MSLGKSKSDSSQTFDPELKGLLTQTFATGQALSRQPFQPYDQPTVAPLSPVQLEAMNQTADTARAGVGQGAIRNAIRTTRAETGFQPMMVNANQVGADPIQAERVRGRRVQAAQFDPNAMSRYTNPYEDQVVQQTISDLDQARQLTQNQNAANAVSAGAFGGDRDALVRAETNRNFLSEVGRQTGALRQAGFDRGTALQEADLGRQQQAGMQTAAFGQQAALANQARRLAADQASAQLNLRGQLANQDAGLRAALANQAAAAQGSAIRQGAAQQLAGLGGALRSAQFGDAAALQGVGDQQQAAGQRLLDDRFNRFLQEREYPFRMFDVLRSGAGILPNPLTSSSRGRSTSISLPTG